MDAFVQQIGQSNPELLRTIQQNQEAFVSMLNEATPASSESSGGGGGGGVTAPAVSGGGSGGGPRPGPDQNTILVSPQDRDAIQRVSLVNDQNKEKFY